MGVGKGMSRLPHIVLEATRAVQRFIRIKEDEGVVVIDVVRAAHGERKQFWSETSAKRYDKI